MTMFQNGVPPLLGDGHLRSSGARCRVLIAALVVGATTLFAPNAKAQSSLAKFSPDLLKQLKLDPDSGLVSNAAGTKSLTKTTHLPTVPVQYKVLVRVAGKVPTLPSITSKYYAHTHIHAMKVGARQLMTLLANPNVKSLSLERSMANNDFSSVPLDVNPVSVGADAASSEIALSGNMLAPSLNGYGVTVAVVDSGISPVDDVKSHLIAFHDCVNGLTAPYDDYGHGTHVAGIIAGDGTDSSGPNAIKEYQGIAPAANLVGVKVLDGQGSGTSTNVIAGIEWCIANKDAYNIRVINMSLTGPVLESYKTDPVCQAVEAAVQSGIVVVVSAGNLGGTYGRIGSPANDPFVITVGASNSMQTASRDDDKITTYTSRGPTMFDENVKPDLIAPGNKVVSLRVPGSYIDLNNAYCYVDPSEYLFGDTTGIDTNYTRLSGTSMSAPAVAGAAALLLQENGSLYPGGVKLALMYSAQLLTGPDPVIGGITVTYDPFTQGAGELNIPGAVQLASLMTPSGLTAAPSMSSTLSGSTVTWFGAAAPAMLGTSSGGNLGSAWWASTEIWSDPGLWSSNNLTWSGGSGIVDWTGNGDNLTWSGGSGIMIWSSGGDNLTWSGGGDNLTWSGGGDNLTWSGGSGIMTWTGGGDNLTWSRGGD